MYTFDEAVAYHNRAKDIISRYIRTLAHGARAAVMPRLVADVDLPELLHEEEHRQLEPLVTAAQQPASDTQPAPRRVGSLAHCGDRPSRGERGGSPITW